MGSCKRWPGRPPCGPSLRVRRGPGMPTQSRSRRVCHLRYSRSRVHRIGDPRPSIEVEVTALGPTYSSGHASGRRPEPKRNAVLRRSVAHRRIVGAGRALDRHLGLSAAFESGGLRRAAPGTSPLRARSRRNARRRRRRPECPAHDRERPRPALIRVIHVSGCVPEKPSRVSVPSCGGGRMGWSPLFDVGGR